MAVPKSFASSLPNLNFVYRVTLAGLIDLDPLKASAIVIRLSGTDGTIAKVFLINRCWNPFQLTILVPSTWQLATPKNCPTGTGRQTISQNSCFFHCIVCSFQGIMCNLYWERIMNDPQTIHHVCLSTLPLISVSYQYCYVGTGHFFFFLKH